MMPVGGVVSSRVYGDPDGRGLGGNRRDLESQPDLVALCNRSLDIMLRHKYLVLPWWGIRSIR